MLRYPPLPRIINTRSVETSEESQTPAAPQAVSRGQRGHHRPVRHDLAGSVADAGLFSIMVGMGETYISPFVLALGGGEIAAGLISAVPLLAGAILQLATPFAVRWAGSHKRWVVACSTCQAMSLLLLPIAAWLGSGDVAVWLVFGAATLYWGSGLATGPAWNTWIEAVVPRRLRTRFFAMRVRVSQACILVGFVGGGFALQYGKQNGHALLLFAVIFLVSSLCRFGSVSFLMKQSERLQHRPVERYVTIRQLLSGEKSESGAKLLAYLFSVQVAALIAGPFFAPFMLKQMNMSYQTYALLIGVTFLGKVIALPLWGRFAQRAGARKLLWIGGVSIVPVAGLWIISQAYWYLALVQLFSGVVWAAYELALFLMFFEAIPREERTSVLTVYNFGNSAAQVVGALIGATLLRLWGMTHDAYLWLFVLSSVARALTLGFLLRVPDRHKPTAALTATLRPVSISTGHEGTADEPILSSLDEPGEEPRMQPNSEPAQNI